MTRQRGWLALAIVVQALVLSCVVWRTAPGRDEWGHAAAGLMHWKFGDYGAYRVNPPLVRLWATWPLRFVRFQEPAWTFSNPTHSPKERTEWAMARSLVQANGSRTITLIQLCRMMLLPVALAGTWLVYEISLEVTRDSRAATIAAWLFALSPNVLANAAMITPDLTLAVAGLLAVWAAVRWYGQPTWLNTLLLGIAIGLCIASKFTGAVFAVSAASLICFRAIRSKHLTTAVLQCAGVVLVSWVFLCATYEFDQVFEPLGEFRFTSAPLAGEESNRFAGTWLASIPVPFPAEYVRGIDLQWSEFEGKYDSYLLGKWQSHGWWYYYVVAMAVKEPYGLFLLLLGGAIAGISACSSSLKAGKPPHLLAWDGSADSSVSQQWVKWLIVCVPGLLLFILVSSQTGFTHHFRYVLASLPVAFILAGASACTICRRWHWSRFYVAGLLIAYAASSASVLPRSYAFFSYAIGGPSYGHNYLDNSNLDWGQDLLTAIDWIDRHPDRQVYLLYSVAEIDVTELVPLAHDGYAHLSYRESTGMRTPRRLGWWVVFAQPRLEESGRWFATREPTEVLSPTVAVYNLESLPGGNGKSK